MDEDEAGGGEEPNREEEETEWATDAAVNDSRRPKTPLVLILVGGDDGRVGEVDRM